MAGTPPTRPQTPESACAKRRRALVVAILFLAVAATGSITHILAGTPSTAAVMCVMWFNASYQWNWWMILNERCRNLEQAQ